LHGCKHLTVAISIERRIKKEMKQKSRIRDLLLVTLAYPILVFIASIISQRFIGDPIVDLGNAVGLALALAIYGGAIYRGYAWGRNLVLRQNGLDLPGEVSGIERKTEVIENEKINCCRRPSFDGFTRYSIRYTTGHSGIS